jgi:hypothetical protein
MAALDVTRKTRCWMSEIVPRKPGLLAGSRPGRRDRRALRRRRKGGRGASGLRPRRGCVPGDRRHRKASVIRGLKALVIKAGDLPALARMPNTRHGVQRRRG